MKCRFCGKEMTIRKTDEYKDGVRTEYKCLRCGHITVDHRRW